MDRKRSALRRTGRARKLKTRTNLIEVEDSIETDFDDDITEENNSLASHQIQENRLVVVKKCKTSYGCQDNRKITTLEISFLLVLYLSSICLGILCYYLSMTANKY